ncbi:MAG: sensor histidine kinase [Rubrivivax sp.]|nr:sensor histidine kinase [Rubrivivax sp.]
MNAEAAQTPDAWSTRWQRFAAATVRGYHRYASWLVSISWRRFILLSLALLIVVAIVHDLPPFTWTVTEQVADTRPRVIRVPSAPTPPKPPAAPQSDRGDRGGEPRVEIQAPRPGEGVEISIGRDGVRIGPRIEDSAHAASAAGASAEQARRAAEAAESASRGLRITLPPGASEAVREALEEARREIEQAAREARREAEEAAREAAQAVREADAARREAEALARELSGEPRMRTRTVRYGIGDVMMQFTLLWIVASAILKFTYKGRMQAEVQAKKASATAEAESLKRQVVEARMAAMQAQVEPHFLFNTLASIDHLIETDPARASQMQKNLIALLRASMPTMREATGQAGANGSGVRELGRELAVIRPYLEILKVRMEERLTTEIAVPDGLLSAEFPPMMIQTLVENAIKHGLEPKAEGGHLRVAAEIVHGKLQVTVADTGLGFGRAATAGTGVGLANIRERLQLLYGPKAALTVTENQPSGTVVTVTVPYKTVEGTT